MQRALLLSCITLLFAASASAEELCVAPQATCTPANTHPTVQEALDDAGANVDHDTVTLGAATYTAPSAAGFEYLSSAPVTIQGQGPQTVLEGAFNGTHVLRVDSNDPASRVRSLAVEISGLAPDNAVGLWAAADASGIVVSGGGSGTAEARRGIVLRQGADLDDSTVDLDNDDGLDSEGVRIDGPDSVVTDTRSRAVTAFWTKDPGAILDRVRADGANSGIRLQDGAIVRNCVVTMRGDGALSHSAIYADDADVSVSNCTLASSTTSGGTAGIRSAASGGPANVTATGVVIRGFDRSVSKYAINGHTSHLTISHSNFDLLETHTIGAGTLTVGEGCSFDEPGFVDEAAGDFRPAKGSPLIDKGPPGGVVSSLDLANLPRMVNGRVDVGAFENQDAPATTPIAAGGSAAGQTAGLPAAVAKPALPGSGLVPRTSRPRAPKLSGLVLSRGRARLAVDAAARVTLRIQRRRGKRFRTLRTRSVTARRAGRVSIRLGRLRAGRYRVVAVATTTAGARSAELRKSLTIR